MVATTACSRRHLRSVPPEAAGSSWTAAPSVERSHCRSCMASVGFARRTAQTARGPAGKVEPANRRVRDATHYPVCNPIREQNGAGPPAGALHTNCPMVRNRAKGENGKTRRVTKAKSGSDSAKWTTSGGPICRRPTRGSDLPSPACVHDFSRGPFSESPRPI